MQLHRTSRKSDWDSTPRVHWNMYQRLAARTKGYATPSNAITLFGLLLVGYGALQLNWHHYWLALLLICVGRACDLLDGWLAEKTGTKSPLGELMDVAADKIGIIFVIIAFFASHIAPTVLLILLILPHVLTALLPLLNLTRHGDIHPTRLGKLTMAATWVCFAGYALVAATNSTYTAAIGFVNILALLTIAASLYSTQVYAKQWR